MEAVARTPRERRRFGLAWALIASIVLHLVLLLVSWLFPFAGHGTPRREEESTLHFTFGPVGESDSLPRGEVPIPTPPTPAAPPQDQSASASPSGVPFPPVAQRPSIPAPARKPREESREQQESAMADGRESTGVDLPEEGTEAAGESDATRSADLEPSTPDRTFDIDRALEDFNRAVARGRGQAEDGEGEEDGRTVPYGLTLPSVGFGMGQLEFESLDYDWSDYARQIYIAIWRAWHNRLYQTVDTFEKWAFENSIWNLSHQSRIEFTIQRNGEVTGISLEDPSGCYPLDDSALDALREVILPPLPADFPRGQETVHGRFIAEGGIRNMRRRLTWLKRAGYF